MEKFRFFDEVVVSDLVYRSLPPNQMVLQIFFKRHILLSRLQTTLVTDQYILETCLGGFRFVCVNQLYNHNNLKVYHAFV